MDRDKLQEVMDHWKKVQAASGAGGVPLLEGLRLLSGFDGSQAGELEAEAARAGWSSVVAGDALKKLLEKEECQQPEVSAGVWTWAMNCTRHCGHTQRQGARWPWVHSESAWAWGLPGG